MSGSGRASPNIPQTTRLIAPVKPPKRQDSFPHTPSALSQVSSPGTSNMSPAVKRPLAPAPSMDSPGSSARNQDRRQSTDVRPHSITDPVTGKKKRVSLSCAQCAKRKQKCNREYPCQHCVARKVPELCVPYTPAPSNSAHGLDHATAERLDRIENVLSAVVRHNPGIGGYEAVREWLNSNTFQRFVGSSASTPVSPLIPSSLTTTPIIAPPRRKPTVDGSVPPSVDFDHMERGGSAEEDARVGKGWLGELEGGVPESLRTDDLDMRLDTHGTPAENLQRLITDCGVSPHKVQELVQELPPKAFADRIINWYFSQLNVVRYPIDERLFRLSYDDLYNRSKAIDPANVQALPLVFIVLAIAVRLAPEQVAGDESTRKISSLRMYWSSRRSILIATALQSESIELVLTRLLSAIYLVQIHDRRLTECWSQLGASLRTAQAIGLHRDGGKLGLDPFQTEYRRRLWSYLYHADRLYSLILGRPPSIGDSYTDTLAPSNVELGAFDIFNTSAPPPQPRPLSEPTTATFLILRRSLSAIIGRIVHHFQKLHEPAQYSDVLRLQEEIDQFTQSLPRHFRMRDPDKSLDQQHTWLPVHRFLLLTEVLVTTIILHRPWLLRRLSSNRYHSSRIACFESAKLDFQIRQDFKREVPEYHVFAITGQFTMFNSAMIAGISAIIDPRGNDADQMRRILTTFLEQHPWSEVATLDETTRKEVQIIQTLSRRAAQIFEDTMAPGELNSSDTDSASLLLALRQSAELESRNRPISAGTSRAPWARFVNYPPPPMQSPASSNSMEDDHSQRLLDNWINTNASIQGTLAQGEYMNLRMPVMPNFPTPSFPPTPMPNVFVWGQTPEETLAAPGPEPFPFAHASTSLDGTVLGVNEENSDEYWNTLIDGILETTGSGVLPNAQGN